MAGDGILGKGLQIALGVVQTKVEKEIAGAVVEHRDFEVAANAILKGLAASGGDPVTFCKEVAKYTLQRQALQEIGTVHLDIKEVGAKGAVKRFRKEMGLWWKNAKSTSAKVRLVAAAVAAPVAVGALAVTGALVVLGTGPVGIILAGLFGLLGASGGTLLTRSMWNFLTGALGLGSIKEEVRKEMNNSRLQEAISNLRKEILQKEKDKFSQKTEAKKIGDISVENVKEMRFEAHNDKLKVINQGFDYAEGQALMEQAGLADINLADLKGKDLEDAMEKLSKQINDNIKNACNEQNKVLDAQRENSKEILVKNTLDQKNEYTETLQMIKNGNTEGTHGFVSDTLDAITESVKKQMTDEGIFA